jgi:tetratricopeptide (TPR) repeat protein
MNKKNIYLILFFLIVVSGAAFGRIAANDFINFDDDRYLTANPYIQFGIHRESVQWAFTSVVAGNWHPLTMLSHMLDWSIFGADPTGHHLISLILHIGAVIFLFLFLYKTTDHLWPSAFAAALFALHPLRVESVAWASERKDVLSMVFGMSCLYVYALYVESSKLSRYVICLVLFILSLLSKPMLVTLPFVLLLIDFWPLNRLQPARLPVMAPEPVREKAKKKKGQKQKNIVPPPQKTVLKNQSSAQIIGHLIREKIPFFLITIVFSIITVWAQRKDDILVTLDQLPFLDGMKNAVVSYAVYLGKYFWPFDLAIFYPFDYALPWWKFFLSGMILIVITGVVMGSVKKLPFLLVGWFWYIGTLVPVIGLVKVGNQALADRYMYLPSIGIAISLLWGIDFLFSQPRIRKKFLWPAGILILTVLAALTWKQCGYWKNSLDLFNHCVRVTKNNVIANSSRGNAYFSLGLYEQAIDDYNEVIRLKPDYEKAFNNRGNAQAKLGRYEQAIRDFSRAIELNPVSSSSYYNRGFVYFRYLNDYQRSIDDLNAAIRIKPDHIEAYLTRGLSSIYLGNKNSGCSDLRTACEFGKCQTLEQAVAQGHCH